MKTVVKLITVFLFAVIIVGCTSAPRPSKTEVISLHKELGDLQSSLQKAKSNEVDFFAPDGYMTAQTAFDDALKKAINGDPFDEKANAGMNALQKAEDNARKNRELMREVLVVRDQAKKAGAPTIIPEKFADLEVKLQNNMRLVEKGKSEKAKEVRGELISLYSALELTALERITVNSAQEMIKKAEESGAEELSPKMLALAKKELSLALSVLQAERTQKEKASEHAARSAALAERAMHIAEVVKIYEQRDFTKEDIVLWYQEQLTAIHKPLPGPLSFTQDNYSTITAFESDIRDVISAEAARLELLQKTRKENQTLLSELDQIKQGKIAAEKSCDVELTSTKESYESRLAESEKANEAAQARYEKVQSMFTLAEAEVYRQGHNVLLTTYGFDFPTGQSEIKSDNFVLLNKIIEAIETFDSPLVLVMGHTDSTGSDKTNQALSQKRAETVASFLKKIGKIPDERVNFEGYGESRPVASNETKEGRAKNRRIEILIVNKQ